VAPDSADSVAFLAELCTDRGEFAAAETLFKRALELAPELPAAWAGLARCRRMTDSDSSWLAVAQRLVAGKLPLRQEIYMRFAIGKYFDDVKHYEQAFHSYYQANELTRKYGAVFDRSQLTRQVDRILQEYGRAWLSRVGYHCASSARPIFIVGMPRSGTSLAEQILASHPAVFGAGELTFWGSAFAAYEAAGLKSRSGASMMPGIAADYLQRLMSLSAGARRVIDKMPANFLYAGLIHAAFPRARIIHMQRHPIDTCLSIYFQNFFNREPYTNDFANLAHYYGEYLRITDHWRAVLPSATLLEIPYEALIADQEGWTRRMLEFVGLPWDSKCLDFHLTNRVVITTSKWQVRQKIHSASAGRWRNYEKFVGPLLRLIEPQERAQGSVG
jgi:tetratricopeptide (TPR) repeat protein